MPVLIEKLDLFVIGPVLRVSARRAFECSDQLEIASLLDEGVTTFWAGVREKHIVQLGRLGHCR